MNIKILWYKVRYGMKFGWQNGNMEAVYGKGKYVSVFRKGDYIDIIAHERLNNVPIGTIRITPYQPNHGIMFEYIDQDGKHRWRTHCDYDRFYRMGIYIQEKMDA